MKMERAAVLGAGAVGAYFIPGLMKTLGDRFCVIARGSRAERLKKNGIRINGHTYYPPVREPEEAGKPDLLLVATKYAGLRDALDDIEEACGPDTVVVSPLNGVDKEEIIAGRIGDERIVNSSIIISSERRSDGIFYDPDKTYGITIGEKNTDEETARIRAIGELFDRAGIHWHFSPDIVACEWQKYALNMGNNLVQAVLGVGIAATFDSEHVKFFKDRLTEEVLTVAAAYGVHFAPIKRTRDGIRPAARFSTLQDLDAKRHTEIDMFAGVLMRKAGEKGIRVPYTECMYHLIRALEEKNDGKFDYGE